MFFLCQDELIFLSKTYKMDITTFVFLLASTYIIKDCQIQKQFDKNSPICLFYLRKRKSLFS